MDKIISTPQGDIQFTLRFSRVARYARLSIKPDGSLLVTSPIGANQRLLFDFIKSKAAWIISRQKRLKANPPRLNGPLPRREYLLKREPARRLVRERLEYFNHFYKFSYGRISIRNQKTRWGSCSKSGNLNFNCRILDLPDKLRDYIVVHELCHVREFNHSARFWRLVAAAAPDYQLSRRRLKTLSGTEDD